MQYAVNQYQQVGLQSDVMEADPHRLIQLLFQGACDRVRAARSCLERGDLAGRGEQTGKAMRIIAGLRECLNFDAGDVAGNLDSLYDYMVQRLLEANVRADDAAYEEVLQLLLPIREAWNGIRSDLLTPDPQARTA